MRERADPAQAALLAGIVANPSAFDPSTRSKRHGGQAAARPRAARHVRSSTTSPRPTTRRGRNTAAADRRPDQATGAAAVGRSVLHELGRAAGRAGAGHERPSAQEAQYEADYGGLKIKLSIDLNLQSQAQTVATTSPPHHDGLPSASLVAIANKTGEVRAMVSGDGDYQQSPFNLATMGYRQPGSSFKVFTLAAALSRARSRRTPSSTPSSSRSTS